jgi:hypothetical protein
MVVMNLFAELQRNPRNQKAYRDLRAYYLQIGMLNEADAFTELIRKKFDESPNSNSQQCEHT